MKLGAALLLTMATVAHAGGAKPPSGAKRISIEYTYTSFHSNQLHYKLDWNKTTYTADNGTTIDGKLIEALYAALSSLKPFDDEIRCISHTDDYPHISITIEGDAPVVISTDSNCHANVPWNVTRDGKHFAQFTTDIPKAVYALLAAVDAKHWKNGADSPEASTSFGMEMVALGELSPDMHKADPAAAACAKDFASNPKVKQVFGAVPVVKELGLMCDLATSADCSQVIAQAALGWDGVTAQVALPCAKGTVDIPAAAAAQIAELRSFLDSKVMRTLVKLATDPPRVWNNGSWMAEANIDDGPMLDFTPGKKRIHIRAIGDKGPAAVKFLKALGIDAKTVTKHKAGDPFFETEVDVDFDGKIAKP